MVALSDTVAPDAIQVLDDPRRVRSVLSPLRSRLLRELEAPDSASGLAERMNTTRQKLAYHFRVLEKEGLIELVEERKRRGCTERIMRRTSRALVVDPAVFGAVGDDPDGVQDRFSSAYLIAAAARMVGDVATLRAGARDAGKRLATATQEADIHFESPAAMNAFVESLTGAVARLVHEYDRPDAPTSRPFRLMTGMHPRRDPEAPSETAGDVR